VYGRRGRLSTLETRSSEHRWHFSLIYRLQRFRRSLCLLGRPKSVSCVPIVRKRKYETLRTRSRRPVAVRDGVVFRRRRGQLQVFRGLVHYHRRHDRDRGRVHRPSHCRLRRITV